MVLECTGQDFRCRGRATVDQHHNGRACHDVACPCAETQARALDTAFGVDDKPFIEQGIRRLYSRLQHATRIVAQVYDKPVKVTAQLVFKAVEGIPEL